MIHESVSRSVDRQHALSLKNLVNKNSRCFREFHFAKKSSRRFRCEQLRLLQLSFRAQRLLLLS